MPDINLLKDTINPDGSTRPPPPPPIEPPLTDPTKTARPRSEPKLPSRFSQWFKSLKPNQAKPAQPPPAQPAPGLRPVKIPKLTEPAAPPEAEDIFKSLDKPKITPTDSPPIPAWTTDELAPRPPSPSSQGPPPAPTGPPDQKPIKPKGQAKLEKPPPSSRSFLVDLLPNEFRTRVDPKSKLISLGLTVVIALAIVGASTGLLVVYQTSILKKIEVVRTERATVDQSISALKPVQREALAVRQKTTLVRELFDTHVYWTKFFDKLEQYTIDDVYYTGAFNGSLAGQITLTAVGTSFSSPARQLIAFREATDFVSEVSITGATASQADEATLLPGQIASQQVSFTVSLKLAPDIFIYTEENFPSSAGGSTNTNSAPAFTSSNSNTNASANANTNQGLNTNSASANVNSAPNLNTNSARNNNLNSGL